MSAHVREIMSGGTQDGKRRGGAGQSLVEFSLVLFPLFFILLGIIQFGFIFNTYVTMTNAAARRARIGTIYVYDRSGQSKATERRCPERGDPDRVLASMNMLGKTSPDFPTTRDVDRRAATRSRTATSGSPTRSRAASPTPTPGSASRSRSARRTTRT